MADFKQIVRRVIQIKNSGDIYTAELELAKLELVSNKVVDLIMDVEEKVNTAKEGDII